LRGEIDSLRRQLTQLAAWKKENEKLKVSSAAENSQSRAEEQAAKVFDQEEWEQMPPRKLPPLRRLGLNIMIYANDNNGWFPTAAELQSRIRADAASGNIKPEEIIKPEDVIVLFHGNMDDIPVRERTGTIVARQADFTAGPGGSYARAYLYADGSAVIHAEDTTEKLTAWENERIIPPDLQSQRP
jgi:hypothetical protein